MEVNAKKEDTVKIENHCTMKIRLGYLIATLENLFTAQNNN